MIDHRLHIPLGVDLPILRDFVIPDERFFRAAAVAIEPTQESAPVAVRRIARPGIAGDVIQPVAPDRLRRFILCRSVGKRSVSVVQPECNFGGRHPHMLLLIIRRLRHGIRVRFAFFIDGVQTGDTRVG